MPTDFERSLSELLHTLTPEPPDHLMSPQVATLPAVIAPDTDAEVIELIPETERPSSRRHRWHTIAAAAAVAALAAGVVALTQLGTGDNGRTQHAPNVGPGHSSHPPVPSCRTSQIVVSQGRYRFATHGRAATAQLAHRNRWATACTMVLPAVAVGADSRGGSPFPSLDTTVRIPGHGQVVITAHMRISGHCNPAEPGLYLNAVNGPWAYSFSLGVAGCRLTPVRLRYQLVG